MPTRIRALAALAIAGALVLIPAAASAHVPGTAGPYDYEIGFGTEPAYAGQPNSVQLLLNKHGKPVTDMTDQLNVTVSFGGQTTDLAFEPNFEVGGDGTPGDYRAWFVPSQAGKYTFHLTGTLDGTKFDKTVTSGPSTFAEVQELSSVAFPKVQAPSTQELASRIDQDAQRAQATATTASNAQSAAKTAKTIGILGLVVGAIGLGVAIVALTGRKRTT
jgi:hypothetical protein